MAIPTVPYGGANARDTINQLVAVANNDVPALSGRVSALDYKLGSRATTSQLDTAMSLIYQRAPTSMVTALQGQIDAKADTAALNSSVSSVLARLNASLSPSAAARPGDRPEAFCSGLAGSGLTAAQGIGLVVTNADGAALRVTGSQVIARRQDDAIEPGKVYAARWSVRRNLSPTDPAGDALTLGLAWLDAGKALIGKTAVFEAVLTPFEGRLTRQSTLSLDLPADIVAPAGARYVRPYVQTYGSDGRVDVQVVDFWATQGLPGPKGDTGDVTPAAQAAATAAAAAATTAQAIVASGRYIYPSRAAALVTPPAQSPAVAPGAIQTLGYYTPGDGGDAIYTLVGAEPGHPGKLSITLADGVTQAWYELANRHRLRLKQIGAVGDGVTDDTAAFQAANDFFAAFGQGGTVLGESYRYRVAGEVTITADHLTLRGDGKYNCQIYLDRHDFTVFYVASGWRFAMRHISVQAFAESAITDPVYVVSGPDCVDAEVRDVYMHMVNSGIWLDGPKTDFRSLYLGYLKPGVGIGIRTSNSLRESRKLSAILIEGVPGTPPAYGWLISGVSDVVAYDVRTMWCLTGIGLIATDDTIFSVFLNQCFGDNCSFAGMEIRGTPGNGAWVLRTYLTDCWTCDAKTGSGLNIGAGVKGIEVKGHTSSHCHENGYVVDGAAEQVSFFGGMFGGNSLHGGLFKAGCSGFGVRGGVYGAVGAWIGNGRYGLAVEDGASDHYVIDAHCPANEIGPLYDGGTGLDKHVRYVA